MNSCFHFFLSGLALGAGVCGLHCGVLLAPIVARESRGWKEGVRTGLFFGAGKALVYGIFGGAASYFGYLMRDVLQGGVFAPAAGIALMAMGVWFFFRQRKCAGFFKPAPPFFLGVIEGVLPCGVTLGLVIYIAHSTSSVLRGALSGALFGIGTIAGPLIFVCGLTPYFWRRILRRERAEGVLRLVGSLVFFLWGLAVLIRFM